MACTKCKRKNQKGADFHKKISAAYLSNDDDLSLCKIKTDGTEREFID